MGDATTLRTGVVGGGWPVVRKHAATWLEIVVPFVGSIFAVRHALLHGVTWIDVASFVVFMVPMSLGITVGAHRLFTHRSFEAHPVVEWVVGAWAAMSLQGPLDEWVADHRRHHALADAAGDVHSPYVGTWGEETRGWRGFLHSYIGWRFDRTATDMAVYGKNLDKDRVINFYSRTQAFWVVLSLALPYGFGYVLGGADAAWSALLFGGFLRVTSIQHGSFSVNSVGHRFGRRHYEVDDGSTNSLALALLTAGEGWHNNHHRYPRSYRLGLYAGQYDFGAWFIERLERVGLVHNLTNSSGVDRSMRPGDEPPRPT